MRKSYIIRKLILSICTFSSVMNGFYVATVASQGICGNMKTWVSFISGILLDLVVGFPLRDQWELDSSNHNSHNCTVIHYTKILRHICNIFDKCVHFIFDMALIYYYNVTVTERFFFIFRHYMYVKERSKAKILNVINFVQNAT